MKRRESKHYLILVCGFALIGVAMIGFAAIRLLYASVSPNAAGGVLVGGAAPHTDLVFPGLTDIPHLTMALMVLTVILTPVAAAAVIWAFKTAYAEIAKISAENKKLAEQNRLYKEVNAKYEQNVKTIRTLANGLAHEFSNLLTPVLGYTNMLRTAIPADDPIREDIDNICNSSQHAINVLNKFASIGGGRKDYAYAPLELEPAVAQITQAMYVGKPENVRIHEDYDLKNAKIMGNKAQLKNALTNIFANSIEAITSRNAGAEGPDQAAGHIWIKGSVVRLHGKKFARVSIKDDGAGIDKKFVHQIFDPYYTTKQNADGAGLGLTIVKNIAEQHYAAINVESSRGRGTELTIDFPVIEQMQPDFNIKKNRTDKTINRKAVDGLNNQNNQNVNNSSGSAGMDGKSGKYGFMVLKGGKDNVSDSHNIKNHIDNDKDTDSGSPQDSGDSYNSSDSQAADVPHNSGDSQGAGGSRGAGFLRVLKGGRKSGRKAAPPPAAYPPRAHTGTYYTHKNTPGMTYAEYRQNMSAVYGKSGAAGGIADRPAAGGVRPLARRHSGTANIVVVDENPAVLAKIDDALQTSGYGVRKFDRPFDALKSLKDEPCDVLITAERMRQMSGVVMAELVKKSGGATRILLLIDYTNDDASNLVRREQIDGYLLKPVSASELKYKVSAVIDMAASPLDF